jgi:lipopolysaccharide transport system ATP-binding protein
LPEGRIEVEHVWKKFRRGELHDSLRDLIPAVASRLFRAKRANALADREFWALQDVSFSVRPGEVLGIIGANGAGKSTMLKLLTRILRPTRGRTGIRGRVGALIEIAAGFHPDLTGAENIFLQGCIMGMTRREITTQFDAIVAFSELEDFINTPVKRYSSGMNARLGFAIAAHMQPDVLIIDEVLAVGDFRFQRKAFDRLTEMANGGLPVVIVSHQLDRIASLCTHCLLLDSGRVAKRGSPDECISHYLTSGAVSQAHDGDLPYRFTSLEIEPKGPLHSGDHITVSLRGQVLTPPDPRVRLGIRVRDLRTAQHVFWLDLTSRGACFEEPGDFEVTIELQANTGVGYFAVETALWSQVQRKNIAQGPQAIFNVDAADFSGSINLNPRIRVAARPSFSHASMSGRGVPFP